MMTNVDLGKGKENMYKAQDVTIALYCCDIFPFERKNWKFDCIWDSGSLRSVKIFQRQNI